jgi:hypothetical protein
MVVLSNLTLKEYYFHLLGVIMVFLKRYIIIVGDYPESGYFFCSNLVAIFECWMGEIKQ